MTALRATEAAAYVPDRDLAALLGRSAAWFRTSRPVLEREGFHKKDRLIGLTLLADVQAWIDRRRVVADAVRVDHHQSGDIDYGSFWTPASGISATGGKRWRK